MLFGDSATPPEANLLAMRIQPDEGTGAALRGQGTRAGPRRAQRQHGLHLWPVIRPRRRPRRTRRCCSTRCSATRRSSLVPTRSRRHGRSTPLTQIWQEWDREARPTAISASTRPGHGGPKRPTCRWSTTAGAGVGQAGPMIEETTRLEMDLDNLALARAREQRVGLLRAPGRGLELQPPSRRRAPMSAKRCAARPAADPRLAAHMHTRLPSGAHAHQRADARRHRATLGNLGAALAAINALHRRHPSRAVVVTPSDIDGPATMDAHIYAECKLNNRSGAAEMCTEEILIKAGGELAQHLSRVVTPLLIHDLPVAVVARRSVFDQAVQRGHRHRRSAAGRLGRFPGGRRQAPRGHGHRELRTGFQDGHRLAATEPVARARRTVRPSHCSSQSSTTSARCASTSRGRRRHCASPRRRSTSAGWRRAWAGRSRDPLAADDAEAGYFHGAFRRGRREITVELRPVRTTLDGAQRAAGRSSAST